MAAYFLDSSAVAKLYVVERGTAWLTGLLDPAHGHEAFVVRITAVEVAAVLFRRVRASTLAAEQADGAMAALRHDLGHTYRVIELSPVVADVALAVAERHGLRGYDCVQLAAAMVVQRARLAAQLSLLTLLSADAELNQAARVEGLGVEDPNQSP